MEVDDTELSLCVCGAGGGVDVWVVGYLGIKANRMKARKSYMTQP